MNRTLELAFLGALVVNVQAKQPGAAFLWVFPDAQTTALGGCGTASSDLGPNCYYNPSCLGFGPKTDVTWSHADWLPGLYPDMSYDYFAAAYRINPLLNASLNMTYLQTGLTEVFNVWGEFLGRYRPWDLALSAAVGYQLLPSIAAGAGVKYVHSFFVPEWMWREFPEYHGIDYGGTGRAVALDFGVQYRPLSLLGLGLALDNIGTPIRYTDTIADPLPAILRFGWEVKPELPLPVEVRLVSDVWRDLVSEFRVGDTQPLLSLAEQLEVGAGLELRFLEVASVRLGYFEDIRGQRGGVLAEPGAHGWNTRRISLLRLLFDDTYDWHALDWGFCWGVGVEYKEFCADVAVDEAIYDFPTRNVRLQFSWALR